MPRHIAFIMDGNGRWAKKRGLPRLIGHKKGKGVVEDMLKAGLELGVEYMTFFAFSAENWRRPQHEVSGLMDILYAAIQKDARRLIEKNIRLKVLGDKKALPEKICVEIERLEAESAQNAGLQMNIALNYGGRQEILNAVNEYLSGCMKDGKTPQSISLEDIENNLYTNDMPDPDLIIRTSGEQRLSNFLLWQAAYSEFFFSEVLWPDFTQDHLVNLINQYRQRERRFGKV